MIVNSLSACWRSGRIRSSCREALFDNPNSNAFIAAEGKSLLQAAMSKIEAAYQSAKLTDWFYTRSVDGHWNHEDGFSATIELMNYVEARNLPANLRPRTRPRPTRSRR